MKYSMCADIMFVSVGETGPIWPDTDGILEAMELAGKNHLDAIEFFDWEGRDLERIASKSRETGVGVMAVCAKNGNFCGNPGKDKAFVEGFKESIQAAKKLACKHLIVNANDFDRELPKEEVHASMVKGLKEVAPLAKEAGITILLEPVSGGYFVDSAEPFGMVDEIGSDSVKILYDIFHYQLMEGNICQTIKENLAKIGHIHGAGAPMRCELTEGELNYSYILGYLKEIGYEGTFGLEFFTFEDREEKVKKSCEILVR